MLAHITHSPYDDDGDDADLSNQRKKLL